MNYNFIEKILSHFPEKFNKNKEDIELKYNKDSPFYLLNLTILIKNNKYFEEYYEYLFFELTEKFFPMNKYQQKIKSKII